MENIQPSGKYNYTSTGELKKAIQDTGLISGWTDDSARFVSIFGEDGGLQANATQEEVMEKLIDAGLDENMAGSCWEILNYNTEGDSADIIDENELSRLLKMFGDDKNFVSADFDYNKITLGSFVTRMCDPRISYYDTEQSATNDEESSSTTTKTDDENSTQQTTSTTAKTDDENSTQQTTPATTGDENDTQQTTPTTTGKSEDKSETDKKTTQTTAPENESNTGTTTQTTAAAPEDEADKKATELGKAINRWGTDEKVVYDIINNHKGQELVDIMNKYEQKHGETLEEAIKGDFSGKEEKELLAKLHEAQNQVEFAQKYANDTNANTNTDASVSIQRATSQAATLYRAMDIWGTDEYAVKNIIDNTEGQDLKNIMEIYEQTYGKSLEKAIKSEFSGDDRTELLEKIDKAKQEVQYATNHNKTPIKQEVSFEELSKTQANAIEKCAIDTEDKKALESIITSMKSNNSIEEITNPEELAMARIQIATARAALLFEAMDGIGTDNDTVKEIINTISGQDLVDVMDIYKDTYGKSLEKAIKGDFSGKKEDALVKKLNDAKTEANTVEREKLNIQKVSAMQAKALEEVTINKIGTNEKAVKSIVDSMRK